MLTVIFALTVGFSLGHGDVHRSQTVWICQGDAIVEPCNFFQVTLLIIVQIVKQHSFLSLYQDFIGSSDPKNVKQLIKKQAEWCETTNDSKAAV